jgi:hypothetical protein
MSNLRYYLPELGQSVLDSMSIHSSTKDPKLAAESAAENAFGRNACDSKMFPLKVAITDDASNDLGTFEVEVRAVPEFTAKKLTEVQTRPPAEEEP